MQIIANDNSIRIITSNNASSEFEGAIEFMGFRRIDNSSEYVLTSYDNDFTGLIVELVDYLNSENLDYELDQHLKTVLDNIHSQEDIFSEIKETALAFKNGVFDIEDFTEFRHSVSSLVQRPLKEHQEKAAYHLYKIGNGANFSVPGSGKTQVVLSVYEKLKEEGEVNTLFVVGPLSSFGPWKHEFLEVLGRNPKSKTLAGGDSLKRKINYYDSVDTKSELYLTSFQTLLSDSNDVRYLFEEPEINVFLVIDEAHYIKRIDGQWASAVLGIANLSKRRCILTGTPIPKSYSDTFNLFDFLWPGELAINEDSKIKVQSAERNGDFERASLIIQDKINPLFYRVRKTELGLKEQIFNDPIIIRMNPLESTLYKAIYNRIEDYSKSDYARNIQFISDLYRGRIIRLRQAISNVGLLANSIDNYGEELIDHESELREIVENYHTLEVPAKISALISKVRELNSEFFKVVIWSNFIGTIKLIQNELFKEGLNSKIIYGGIPVESDSSGDVETREKIRQEFIDPTSGLDIIIANPAACAESISLHQGCQNAIYYDLSYNCAQYLQTLDRIHRVGASEKRPSYYHFLQYEETIDRDIMTNLLDKAARMNEVVEQNFPIYSLDMEDDMDELEAYKRLFKIG